MGKTSYSTSTTNNLTVTPITDIDVDTAPIGEGLTNQAVLYSNVLDKLAETGAETLQNINTQQQQAIKSHLDKIIKVFTLLFLINIIIKGVK